MKIFVTGGSGFIGGHIIESLVTDRTVVAMARSDRSAEVVAAYGAEPVRCSLGTVDTKHLKGMDAVVHCAAFVGDWGTRQQFWSVNVDGTTKLLDMARSAGVAHFIHIGTEAALFDGHDLVDIDESYPYPKRHKFLYSETKAEAERRVLEANAPGFRTVSIRPRFVWGPRDTSVLPVLLRMIDSGKWRWIDGGKHETSTTHVANLVHGVRLALERGAGGNAYFVADAERSTIRDFISQLVETQGRSIPDGSVPSTLARPMAWLIEGTWRLLGLKHTPPMTRFGVAMMSCTVTVRWDKAAAELGYNPLLTREDAMDELTSSSY